MQYWGSLFSALDSSWFCVAEDIWANRLSEHCVVNINTAYRRQVDLPWRIFVPPYGKLIMSNGKPIDEIKRSEWGGAGFQYKELDTATSGADDAIYRFRNNLRRNGAPGSIHDPRDKLTQKFLSKLRKARKITELIPPNRLQLRVTTSKATAAL